MHDMSTPIRTDYEALVGLLDSKIDLLLRKYHTRLIPYLCIHVYNKSMDMWDTNLKKRFCYGINMHNAIIDKLICISLHTDAAQKGQILENQKACTTNRRLAFEQQAAGSSTDEYG